MIWFFVFFSLFQSPVAYANKRILKATVKTDGAMVFQKPSFESDVISYLKNGQIVQVTRKSRRGFRKVKVRKGLIGFIRVEDVRTEEDEDAPVVDRDEQEDIEKDPLARDDEPEQLPFAYQKFVGPVFGILNYGEDLAGQKVQSNLTAFGVKLSGADILIDGPLIDWNIVISSGAPKYYQQITGKPASGFLLVTDYRFMIPVSENGDRLMYFAAGPLVTFSQFNAQLGESSLSMQQLNIGLSLGGGLAMRFGRFAFRAEVNSHWEVSRYFSLLTSFQFAY